MAPQSAANEPAPPTVAELKAFDELITAGYFNENCYRADMRSVLLGWLQDRVEEIPILIRRYRVSGPELLPPLLELANNLNNLFEKIDNLCGGSHSYLAMGGIGMTGGMGKFFNAFLRIWDELSPVLQRYRLLARAYDEAYKQGKVINLKVEGFGLNELRKQLIEKLNALQVTLQKLVAGICESLNQRS
jgi:hypothetical protein